MTTRQRLRETSAPTWLAVWFVAILLTVILSLVWVLQGWSLGVEDENCDAVTGTLITVGQDVDDIIEAGTANQVYRLAVGTHSLNNELTINKSGITLRANGNGSNECVAATLNFAGNRIRIQDDGSNFVLSGLTLSDTGTPTGKLILLVNNHATKITSGVTVRNNVINFPTHPSELLLINGPFDGTVIANNEWTGNVAGGAPIGVGACCAPELGLGLTGRVPQNTEVSCNTFHVCGKDCVVWNQAEGFPGSGTITDNYFACDGAGTTACDENAIDIKSASGNIVIRRNRIIQTKMRQAGVLIHETPPPNVTFLIDHNYFYDCAQTVAGSSNNANDFEAVNNVTIQHNLFVDAGQAACPAGNRIYGPVFGPCVNCVMKNNTLVTRGVDIGTSEGNPTNLAIADNIFSAGAINDDVVGASYSCARNHTFNTTGTGFLASCTGATTGNPLFVSSSDFNVTNTALHGTGAGGVDIGALQRPVVASCEVGSVSTTTMTVNFTNPYEPIRVGTHANFVPKSGGTPKTLSSSSVQGTNQIRLVVTSAWSGGNDIDLELVQGAACNSQDIGGPTISLDGCSSATAADVQCTNNIGAGAPTYTFHHWRLYPANCTLAQTEFCKPMRAEDTAGTGGTPVFKPAPDAAFQLVTATGVSVAAAPSQGYNLRCKKNTGAFFDVTAVFNGNAVRIGENVSTLNGNGFDSVMSLNGRLAVTPDAGYYVAAPAAAYPAVAVPSGSQVEHAFSLALNPAVLVPTDTITCEPKTASGTTMTVSTAMTLTIGAYKQSFRY